MNMDASKWMRFFQLSAEKQWYWKVRFINDPRPYNEVIYEPMDPRRIADTTIRDGYEGPFYYRDVVWVRVPNSVEAGTCIGVRSSIKQNLSQVTSELHQNGIPFVSRTEHVHVGEEEL